MPDPQPAGGPHVQGVWRQLPNAITVLRVVLAASFFTVLTPWHFDRSPLYRGETPDWTLVLAIVLFLLAAATDALDGYLARKWQVITVFGRIMDPFADKLLIIGGFVYLAGPGFVTTRATDLSVRFLPLTSVHAWMVAVILARELLVTSIRAVYEGQGVEFTSSLSGKLKMILQSLCIPAVLLLLNVPGACDLENPNWAYRLIQVLVWSTVVVTVWSGIPYVTRAFAAARAAERQIHSGLTRAGEMLITTFGLGFMRPAPGTWGSLPPIGVAALLMVTGAGPDQRWWVYTPVMGAMALIFTYICLVHSDAAEARFIRKDPSQIVADETAGMALALVFLPAAATVTPGRAALTLLIAFLAFRMMDIVKPFPARRIQRAPGGWGVVLDDLIAGAYALGATLLLVWLLWLR